MSAGSNSITLGGVEWRVAPLNVKALKLLGTRLFTIGSIETESLDALVDALHLSILRVDINITREWIEEHLELSHVADAAELLITINKMRTEKGEAIPGQ